MLIFVYLALKFAWAKILRSPYMEAEFFNDLGQFFLLFLVLLLFLSIIPMIDYGRLTSDVDASVHALKNSSYNLARLISFFSFMGRMNMWCMGAEMASFFSGPENAGSQNGANPTSPQGFNFMGTGMNILSYCGLYLHISYFLSPIYSMLKIAVIERYITMALINLLASNYMSLLYLAAVLYAIKPFRGYAASIIGLVWALRVGIPISFMVADSLFPVHVFDVNLTRDLSCEYTLNPFDMMENIRQVLNAYLFSFSFESRDGHLIENGGTTFTFMAFKYMLNQTIFYPTLLITGFVSTLWGVSKILGGEVEVQMLARLV